MIYMKIFTSYSVKIKDSDKCFADTVRLYRSAVDFFLSILLEEEDAFADCRTRTDYVNAMEQLTVITQSRSSVPHDFGKDFYKFPSYLRRAAIADAFGKASAYHSKLQNWEALSPDEKEKTRKPGLPQAGFVYPALYKDNMCIQTGEYTFRIKVWKHNTWDWTEAAVRKSDMDYITRRCGSRKRLSPTLRKRGKCWYLDFPFEEKAVLPDTDIFSRMVLAVDLGINNAATASVMASDGTVLGRHFLKLPRENDSLMHALNRIKKAQQQGTKRMPRLWAKAKGINQHIASKTAQFIIDTAILYNADVIVFEHLDLQKKKKGSKKQRLHLWKAEAVQRMVTDRAHRLGMRISHVNAWDTSALAFDGSGKVLRGKDSRKTNGCYSICEFTNGKVYHCDLNATYNIGARYFIREILKSLSVTARLDMEAKVPPCSRRSTCTLSTLITLYAGLAALWAA